MKLNLRLVAAVLLVASVTGCKRPGQPKAVTLPAPNGSPANVAHIPHVVYGFKNDMAVRHAQTLPVGSVLEGEPFPRP